MDRWIIILWCVICAPVQAQDVPRLGIFGLVENVSPLVVAGRQISQPDTVPVISPLGPKQPIMLGDTLAVAASVAGEELRATRIMQVFPAVGPVSAAEGNTAVVMGSEIYIPSGMTAKAGRWVALSGLWSGDKIITSNLRTVDGDGFGHLAGVIEGDGQHVGGSQLFGGQWPTDGFGDDIWLLGGAPDVAGLRVQLMTKGVFGGEVDLALWQGYASAPIASQTYTLHGLGVVGTARDAQMPDAGTLIVRCAVKGRVIHAAPDGQHEGFAALGCP